MNGVDPIARALALRPTEAPAQAPVLSVDGRTGAVSLTDRYLGAEAADRTVTVATAADLLTTVAALNRARGGGETITLQLAAGEYLLTAPLVWTNPTCTLELKGPTPVETAISAGGTASGSAGAWTTTFTVAATAGLAPGRAIITTTSGTGGHETWRGLVEITAINSGTSVTVRSADRRAAIPANSVTGGTLAQPSALVRVASGRVMLTSGSLTLHDLIAASGGSAPGTEPVVFEVGSKLWIRGIVGVATTNASTAAVITGSGHLLLGGILATTGAGSGIYTFGAEIFGNGLRLSAYQDEGLTAVGGTCNIGDITITGSGGIGIVSSGARMDINNVTLRVGGTGYASVFCGSIQRFTPLTGTVTTTVTTGGVIT